MSSGVLHSPMTAATTTVQRGNVTYGFLQAGDPRWAKVRAAFAERHADPPAETTVVIFAESDDHGFSFYCLQPMLHAEPLLLHPAHRGNAAVLRNLLAAMQAAVEAVAVTGQNVYVVADTPATAAMCEAMGCERIDVPVYRRTVVKPQGGVS
jgi:hypothetical protein